MTWLLDTNVFINAAQKYYAMDFCPGFWEWLKQHADQIHSLEMVKAELAAKEDELYRWCEAQLPEDFFREADDDVQTSYLDVVEYVNHLPESPYSQVKKDAFLDGADPMLVAYAMKHGETLVTNEKFNPAAHKKIYLPNVANYFNINCADIFQVMRELDARLVLESK